MCLHAPGPMRGPRRVRIEARHRLRSRTSRAAQHGPSVAPRRHAGRGRHVGLAERPSLIEAILSFHEGSDIAPAGADPHRGPAHHRAHHRAPGARAPASAPAAHPGSGRPSRRTNVCGAPVSESDGTAQLEAQAACIARSAGRCRHLSRGCEPGAALSLSPSPALSEDFVGAVGEQFGPIPATRKDAAAWRARALRHRSSPRSRCAGRANPQRRASPSSLKAKPTVAEPP